MSENKDTLIEAHIKIDDLECEVRELQYKIRDEGRENAELTRENNELKKLLEVPKKTEEDKNTSLYCNDIITYAQDENEIYVEVEYYDDNFDRKNKYIIFEAWDVLHSGLSDGKEIKKKLIDYIKKIK